MIAYVDSSALFKAYFDEPGSADVIRLMSGANAVVTSALAYPEIRAAFSRRRRERTITPAQFKSARQQFDSDWPTFLVLPIDDALARRAGALADEHGLRGADAVHLAAFERLVASATEANDEIEFSCADDRLSRAARNLG